MMRYLYGRSELGILFSLTMKDFPQVTLPLDIDPNPSGRGGSQEYAEEDADFV